MKRKKEGYKSRLDESLGMKNRSSHKQSLSSRRHESEGMEKKENYPEFSGDLAMDRTYQHHMANAHTKHTTSKHRKSMYKRP